MATSHFGHFNHMGRSEISMVNTFLVALIIGSALGFLSGLGTGGGSLLILWLTLVIGMDGYTSRLINLMFFIPSAVIVCLFRAKQHRFHVKKVLPAIIAGSISSGICAIIVRKMDIVLLQRCFGYLLLLIGTRQLLSKPKK